jgi:hypothetical protein
MNIWELFTGSRYRSGGRKSFEDEDRDSVSRRACTATDSEWEYITEQAYRHNISTSAYLRLLIKIDQKVGGITEESIKKIKKNKAG